MLINVIAMYIVYIRSGMRPMYNHRLRCRSTRKEIALLTKNAETCNTDALALLKQLMSLIKISLQHLFVIDYFHQRYMRQITIRCLHCLL